MKYKKLIIFDLDGTLIDSITDVAICFNQALSEYSLPTHKLADFGKFVGGDLEQVITKMLPIEFKCDNDLIAKIGHRYRQLYSSSTKPNTVPYTGIVDLLIYLRSKNCAVAVNTNKNHILANEVTGSVFPDFKFDYVLGSGGDIAPKPSRDGVDMIASALGVSIKDSCYIGDTLSDVLTAKNAKIPCFYVKWGQGKESDIDAYERLTVCSDIKSLKDNLDNFIEVLK